jgi:hypothetical protein
MRQVLSNSACRLPQASCEQRGSPETGEHRGISSLHEGHAGISRPPPCPRRSLHAGFRRSHRMTFIALQHVWLANVHAVLCYAIPCVDTRARDLLSKSKQGYNSTSFYIIARHNRFGGNIGVFLPYRARKRRHNAGVSQLLCHKYLLRVIMRDCTV